MNALFVLGLFFVAWLFARQPKSGDSLNQGGVFTVPVSGNPTDAFPAFDPPGYTKCLAIYPFVCGTPKKPIQPANPLTPGVLTR